MAFAAIDGDLRHAESAPVLPAEITAQSKRRGKLVPGAEHDCLGNIGINTQGSL